MTGSFDQAGNFRVALDLAIRSGGLNYVFDAGIFKLKNVETGTLHAVAIAGIPGAEQLVIYSPDTFTLTNFRIYNNTFQLINVDTSLFHTIYIAGVAGAEQLLIYAGEP